MVVGKECQKKKKKTGFRASNAKVTFLNVLGFGGAITALPWQSFLSFS